jgi:capsular exopolysaccharide synthesis family protein
VSEHWNDESAFRDWLSLLLRQRWILLAAVVVVPVIAFWVSHSEPALYEASATVLVNQQNTAAATLNLNAVAASPPDRYAATQAALARVGTVAELAVKAAGVPGHTAAGLLAKSSVSANPTADLLTFSVTDPVPAVAEKLATAYATQFTVYRRRLDTGALSAALADVHRRLAALAAAGQSGSPLYRRLNGTSRDLEALQTLEASGASAVVVGKAGGASQVQPKTSRNVVLGILVGIALGVGLAFLREALDTRVRSADELRGRLGMPLLGHVPKPDRAAAEAETLVTLAEPAGASAEAFRILKTSLDISQLQHHVGSIVVTSTHEGEGKSTTVANLAVILARSGRHVILVDLDLRHPRIDSFFDLDGQPGLTSVAVGEAELADALCIVDVHPEPTVAAAGMLEVVRVGVTPPDPGEFLSSGFVTDALAALAARCDVLLIDTPPMLAVGDAMAIATRTDALILVAGLNQVRRASLAETRRMLEACPALKLGFIATGGNGSGGYGYQYPSAERRQEGADA